jgi:DNA modification methylase
MFTKEGDTVLDPFVGVGSTLKACAVTRRNGIGIELSPAFVALAEKRMEVELPSGHDRSGLRLYEGDVREIAPQLLPASVGYIVTSPPYWGILNKIDHKARQERTALGLRHNYGDDSADLAHVGSYGEFIDVVSCVLSDLYACLQPKRYMTVIVGDFRHKERYFMYHSDLATAIEKRKKFALKGITVIHQKFKRVFPYGYPHAFVPNIHHQYALTFQRIP